MPQILRPSQRLPRYLTQVEVRAFFAAISSPRDRALFALIYHYGLRVGEVALLRCEDVDLERGRIVIKRLKGGARTEQPLSFRVGPTAREIFRRPSPEGILRPQASEGHELPLGPRLAKEPGMLAARQLAEVDAVLGQFCRQKPTASVRDKLRYAVRVKGSAVDLVECRPVFHADIGWRDSPVARFRFNATAATWSLFWRDRNLRWHRYDRVRPAKPLATLFAEVQRDPTGIFWG